MTYQQVVDELNRIMQETHRAMDALRRRRKIDPNTRVRLQTDLNMRIYALSIAMEYMRIQEQATQKAMRLHKED